MAVLKIGVDASCWMNKRGYGRYTRQLLRTLLTLDHENEYRLFLDAETARRSTDLPERANRVIVETSRPAALAASASGHRAWRDVWAMRTAVHHRGRDLDLFFFPSVYTFFPLANHPKVIVTIHDTIAERYPKLIFPTWRSRLLWTLKTRWALRQADLLITVSEAARDSIVKTFGVRREAVDVVPDAADDAFHPLDRQFDGRRALAKYRIADNARIILHVGGLSPHKNLVTLVDAYARLIREKGSEDVTLVLVGDFQGDVFYSSYPALRQHVNRLGLVDRVIFTGFVPDSELIYLYNAAQMLVMPSFDEGFGLPAVEAMACGIPVIASRTGALLEVVADAGLFFDPRSSEDLANCLVELLENPWLRHALAQKAICQARRYSWERSARAALAAFERVTRHP